MSTPQISFVVLQYVQDRLLDVANSGFNQLIQETSTTYSVPSFQLSLNNGGGPCGDIGSGNLYVGRFELASLVAAGAPQNYPIAVLSIAKDDNVARANLQVTPSTFSGMVIVSLDFYVQYATGSVPANSEGKFCAIEDALVSTFNIPASYALTSAGILYNNEISVEQGRMEYGGSDWKQLIAVTIIFRLVT